MTRTIHCPNCAVELTIPDEAGSRRLRCPKCATRFYPNGPPTGKSAGPASSILAAKAEPSRSPKRSPRSPRPKPSASPSAGPRRQPVSEPTPDLRDLLDIPLVDDSPQLPGRPAQVADAASLMRDDPPADRRKKAVAEAKREARRCPSCGSVVLSGMSLCERCGLDLDTGQRIEMMEDALDEAPPPMAVPGPPATVLVIGVVAMVAGLALTALSLVQLEGWGRLLLVPVCLFGAFAGLMFLRGKALRLMVVALMLGGGVDLVALIILPIVVADEQEVPHGGVISDPNDGPIAITNAGPEAPEGPNLKPLTERIDATKIAVGIAIFLMIGVMLILIATPGVRHYFEKRRQSLDEGYVLP